MTEYCRPALAIAIGGALTIVAPPTFAKQYEVKMLNRGAMGTMVFEPALVKVAPGDTVVFLPTDKGHNVQSIPGMIPEGAPAFQGKFNETVKVTFSKQGLYVYKCLPHYAMGMIGVVQVGRASNKDQIAAGSSKLPLLAKKRLGAVLTQVK